METTEINDEQVKEFYTDTPQENIELKRENRFYPGGDNPTVTMPLKDLPIFFMDRLRESNHEGTVPQTVMHYVNQMNGIVDDQVLSNLQRVANEIHNNRFDDDAVERGRREILEIVGQMKVLKKGE